MKYVVLFTALLGISAALPTNLQLNQDVAVRNTALEQLVLDLLEELRELMRTGSEDIPILDPLLINEIKIEGADVGLPGSHAHLEALTVASLSTFEVHQLSISLTSIWLQTYSFEFDGSIPVIDARTENYDLFVSALGYNIFGNGELGLKIVEPRLSGSVTLRVRVSLSSGINLQLETVDLRFQLSDFQPDIKGIFGSDIANGFVNSFLRNLVMDLLEVYDAEITDLLNTVVFEVGNEILDGLDLSGILGRQAIEYNP